MAQGLIEGLRPDLSERSSEERPPGGRQDDPAHVPHFLTGQALENAAVLAVHGNDPGLGTGRFPLQEGPGDHHGLLVGQSDLFPGLDGGQRRPEAVDAGDGRDDDVVAGPAGHLGGALGPEGHPDLPPSVPPTELGGIPLRPQGDDLRLELRGLLEEEGDVGARGQAGDPEPIFEPGRDLQGAPADRSGRAEDGDVLAAVFHGSQGLISREP